MAYIIEYTYSCNNDRRDLCTVNVAKKMYGITIDTINTKDNVKHIILYAEDIDTAEELIEMVGGTCEQNPTKYEYIDSSAIGKGRK